MPLKTQDEMVLDQALEDLSLVENELKVPNSPDCAILPHDESKQDNGAEDFIRTYVEYADVLEAPPEAHEAVAAELLASVLNPHVHIENGAVKVPLDLWLLLLSGSGFGRNTLIELARPILKSANLEDLILRTTWGSSPAFYQNIAEHPSGLFVWPELSFTLKKLGDKAFDGAKEWLTDRYDSFEIPHAIRYRRTGKKSDTPPIVFSQAPRLNILATSSVDWFISNITPEDALGGFVPRWIFNRLYSDKSVPRPECPNQLLIEPLAEHLHKANKLEGVADLSRVWGSYEGWYAEARSRFSEHPNANLAMPFFNRLRTHILKLAVIYEVSQSLTLQVTPTALDRAIRTAKDSERAILGMLASGITKEGIEVDRMAEFVKRGSVEGVAQSDLTRAFQSIRPFEREGRLKTLVESREVFRFSRSTSGRPAIILVHKDYVEEYRAIYPTDREF